MISLKLLSAVSLLLILLTAPMIARIGATKTLHTWTSTSGALGIAWPLTLSLCTHTAYVDVLGCYSMESIVITDGGYAYVLKLKLPDADEKTFADKCQVVWGTDKVEFRMRGGEVWTLPATLIKQQIGSHPVSAP